MGLRVVAMVPIFGLLLTGCTGSAEEPLPQPPPFTAGPTATPTPTPVALEVPPSARATDAVGAAQFAQFYVEVLEKAYRTGDSTQLKTLSDPLCQACARFVAAVDSNRADGTSTFDGEYTILSAEASESVPGDAVVDVL